MLSLTSTRRQSDRFCKALQQFASNTGATPEAISRVVDRPLQTVYKWLDGSRAPSRRVQAELCKKFNWNQAALFSGDALLDQVIDQAFLSFEALNHRYMYVVDRFTAVSLVSVGGVMAFHHLTERGLSMGLHISPAMHVSLSLLDANAVGGLVGSYLLVSGTRESGLQVCLFDSEDQIAGCWQPLTKKGLDYYFDVIKTYSNNA